MHLPSVEILEDRTFLSGLGAVGEDHRWRESIRGIVIAFVAGPEAIEGGVSMGIESRPGLRVVADVDLGVGSLGVVVDLAAGQADVPVGVSLDIAADLDPGLADVPVGVSADVGLGLGSVGVSLDAELEVNLGHGEGDSGEVDPEPGSNPGEVDPEPGSNPGEASPGPGGDSGGAGPGPGGDSGGASSKPGNDPRGAGPGPSRNPEGVGIDHDPGPDPGGAGRNSEVTGPRPSRDPRGAGSGPAGIPIDDLHDSLVENPSFQPYDHWRISAWVVDSVASLDAPDGSEPYKARGGEHEAPEGDEPSEVVTRVQDGNLEAPGHAQATSAGDLADYPSFPLTVFKSLVQQLHRLLGGIGGGAEEWFPSWNWSFTLIAVPLIAAFLASRLARWAHGSEVGDDEEKEGEPNLRWDLGSSRPFPYFPYE